MKQLAGEGMVLKSEFISSNNHITQEQVSRFLTHIKTWVFGLNLLGGLIKKKNSKCHLGASVYQAVWKAYNTCPKPLNIYPKRVTLCIKDRRKTLVILDSMSTGFQETKTASKNRIKTLWKNLKKLDCVRWKRVYKFPMNLLEKVLSRMFCMTNMSGTRKTLCWRIRIMYSVPFHILLVDVVEWSRCRARESFERDWTPIDAEVDHIFEGGIR